MHQSAECNEKAVLLGSQDVQVPDEQECADRIAVVRGIRCIDCS